MKNENKFSPGDEVIVVQGYPSDKSNSWYKKGDIITLNRKLFTDYWIPDHKAETSNGIFEHCFRHLTKLDKALK